MVALYTFVLIDTPNPTTPSLTKDEQEKANHTNTDPFRHKVSN